MEELQMRQRTTLAEVSVPSSSSVRREEELRQLGSDRGRSLSLGAVIAVEKLRSSSAGITRAASSSSNISSGGRTLLDIIRDEEQSTGRGSDHTTGGGSSSSANRINWRAFKNRLRIRRSSNGGDDRPENISPTDSPPEINEPQTPPADNPPQQIRMSLMALLEQTDNQGARSGVPVSALLAEGEEEGAEDDDDDEDEDDDDDDGTGEDGGKMYVKCCVCMVRHKGAAFIPCGHTFCRLCSRELWISRGNCPLCNGFILEILDIF